MGLTYIKGVAQNAAGKRVAVKFLVDSGASYTLLPYRVWRTLGLKGMESIRCELADGTEVERRLSECLLELDSRQRHTPVILGEKDDSAPLGAITLEEFGLVLNPFTRELQPMRMMLARTNL
jgi:predicted aspartyl protease